MPPKTRITRDQIAAAAFAIARSRGAEQISARSVARELGCSTQPVLSCFPTVEAVRQAAYARADAFHTAYLTEGVEGPLELGVRYIRFAAQEGPLFRFLFQSGAFSRRSVGELLEAEELEPVLAVVGDAAGLEPERVRRLFRTVFLFAHGYASMFANNDMVFDEAAIAGDLRRAYAGALYAVKEERE